jgi:hypothetical protein
MIDFTVPDFTVGLKRNLVFAQVMQACPQFFYSDVRIQSVYGCFPGCIVNGGRAFVLQRYTPEQVEAIFQALDQFGLTARLTFTNMLVEERHLQDEYFNMILDAGARHGAGVIVYSELVNEYVKARYPQMERTLSTTREILDASELDRALGAYDMVVLNYNLNKDYAFLDKVAHARRLEVMANELCNPHCPHRREHYLHNSADQLNGTLTEFRRCNLAGKNFFKLAPTSPTILTGEEVRGLHERYEVQRFKLVGRGVASDVNLESYLYYLVRPEHRDGLRHAIKSMLG